MPTIFDQLLANLKAAQGDTAQLALVTLDFAVSADPILREAAEVAAIPHWFDADTLAVLLPEHAGRADCLLEQLATLPMVERYNRRDGKNAFNLHEATRLAVRDRLFASDPERFRALSRRAAAAYGSADPDAPDFTLTCEHLYHQLAGQTDEGDAAMANVARKWRLTSRTERLQTLALLLEEILAAKPEPPLLQRGKGQAYLNIALARENYQSKLVTRDLFEKAEAIFQSLAKSDPANAAWQCDLSVSHRKVGDLAVAQGDLPGALRRFTDCHTILEPLAASDPANAEWQYDLGVSNERLGDIAVARGKVDDARLRYTKRNEIISKLAASDPANAAWQRDLAVSHGRLGELAVAQGDLTSALLRFTDAHAILERLAASDPANAGWLRDVAVSLDKFGDLAVAQGDLPGAMQRFTDSLQIRKRLAASDPANAGWERDLWVSYWNLAVLCEEDGKPADAKGWWRKSHDTLASMKQRGLYLLPEDEGYLATLREIVAD